MIQSGTDINRKTLHFNMGNSVQHSEANTTHNSEHLTHPKYRADIDGLRAIAVLSVVGFHAFPFWVKGGFIGVDIFFVISGFLISTIIFGNLERNSFSFAEFYSRRIKRIFPALFLVLIASFVFGWFVLMPDEYMQLGKHIAGGAGFISNFVSWNESGYFDNAAETKPLLHLWTLGIEEQFYIFWPLFLWLAWKQRLNLLAISIAVAAISFVLNISEIRSNAVAAFYSPQTRFWELMAGSTLAYITLHKQNMISRLILKTETWLGKIVYAQALEANGKTMRNVQSVFGAVLVVIGILVITKERHFPGWWAVLPVLGAVLLISAGEKAWINRVVLSNRILVWFGLISYPLYLWHWPLLSFARIMQVGVPSHEIRIVAVIVSIVLAWLTYQLIEKPIRFGKHSKAKTTTLFVSMIAVGLVGCTSYKLDGFGFRVKDREEFSNYTAKYVANTDYAKKNNSECNFYDLKKHTPGKITRTLIREIPSYCFERKATSYNQAVFIWGDSHAEHLYFGLKNNLPPNWQILQVASSACPADVNVKEPSTTDYCSQSNWFALKTISETKPEVVIVAQKSRHDIKSFKQISAKLKNLGVKKIIIVGSTPRWTAHLPKIILKELWMNTPRRTFVGIDQPVLARNSKLQNAFKQTDTEIFANLIDFLCNKDGCLTYIGDDKKTGITSWDYGHLTLIASDYLAKNLLVNLIVDNNNTKTQ